MGTGSTLVAASAHRGHTSVPATAALKTPMSRRRCRRTEAAGTAGRRRSGSLGREVAGGSGSAEGARQGALDDMAAGLQEHATIHLAELDRVEAIQCLEEVTLPPVAPAGRAPVVASAAGWTSGVSAPDDEPAAWDASVARPQACLADRRIGQEGLKECL